MAELQYIKMDGAGNDFIIFDARKTAINLSEKLSKKQIQKISDRKNIGCDQLIIIKNSDKADAEMEIYNTDGSRALACGNASRCVASLVMAEKKQDNITLEVSGAILNCQKVGELISVEMGLPKFIGKFDYKNFDFYLVEMPNPHAVCFVDEIPKDEIFFKIGKEVETHPHFKNKTNVEFVKIISPDLVEVRVFERGAGETLACGSGACAVGAVMIKNNLTKSKKITTRFKGGDLIIDWQSENSPIIMTGNYKKISSGKIDENF